MLENRPIVSMAIGYIIGIIMGLYCKISVVLFHILFFFIYQLLKIFKKQEFKLISFKRYARYLKLIVTKKVLIVIIISSIFSNTITLYQNYIYDKIQRNLNNEKIQMEAIVISNVKNKEYKKIYKIKVQNILVNNEKKVGKLLKNKKIYLNISKNNNSPSIKYGDMIKVSGVFNSPNQSKNYKAFNYMKYLQTLGIYGTLDCKHIEKEKEFFLLSKYFNNIFLKIKDLVQENFESKISNIILGITLGYTDEIDEKTSENFYDSNMAHMLAVSGMHVGYILLFCRFLFQTSLGKRISNIFSIIILLFYMGLVGGSSSVIRAVCMSVLMLISKIIHRKNDIWTNISLSLLILLIYNSFLIRNSGLLLSYVGTIGIIVSMKIFKEKKFEITQLNFINIVKYIVSKILNIFKITISVLIAILPILAMQFNKIPIFNLVISPIIGIFAGMVILLSWIFILFTLSNFYIMVILKEFIIVILSKITIFLIKIAEFGSDMPLGRIITITPSMLSIFFYYLNLFVILFILKYTNKKTAFGRRINNLINLAKFRFNQNKSKVISLILIFIIFVSFIKIIPKNLKIYFIDVGQGDSCLIITPQNKKILIDGGGSEDYDIGKNILLPYLLNRGVRSIDYIIVSHFDTDHIGGLLYIMENIKVKNVLISKQFEDTENLKKFYLIVKEKKIEVKVVQAGNRLKIEKNIFIDIIWPLDKNVVSENIINNNSIVCKLHYSSFSMIFTGDIEELAEKEIFEIYKNSKILKSDILKVAHHGSKSSSIQEFLELVKPNIAVIGVGKNNKYGHPNDEVLKRLDNLRYQNL